MDERVRKLLEDLLVALREGNMPALTGLTAEARVLLEES